MTTPANPGSPTGIPGLDSSRDDNGLPRADDTWYRYPLGLPAGSVRALLAFCLLGLLWALALNERGKTLPDIYLYLHALMTLMLAHYFAAHGSSIGNRPGQRPPLFLPRGSVRFLLTAGVAGLLVWFGMHWDEYTMPTKIPMELPFVVLGGFLAGYLVQRVLTRGKQPPYWLQDVEAWIALLCMLCLAGALLFHLFIKPTLDNPAEWQMQEFANPILAGAISFYIGARS
jgi:hypothetical protein